MQLILPEMLKLVWNYLEGSFSIYYLYQIPCSKLFRVIFLCNGGIFIRSYNYQVFTVPIDVRLSRKAKGESQITTVV
jgi:hypothetical protein